MDNESQRLRSIGRYPSNSLRSEATAILCFSKSLSRYGNLMGQGPSCRSSGSGLSTHVCFPSQTYVNNAQPVGPVSLASQRTMVSNWTPAKYAAPHPAPPYECTERLWLGKGMFLGLPNLVTLSAIRDPSSERHRPTRSGTRHSEQQLCINGRTLPTWSTGRVRFVRT